MNLLKRVHRELIENPLITKVELCDKLSITESELTCITLSLHKKGLVNRKGILNRNKDKIIVIGGSNVDYVGKSFDSIQMTESNPGTVKISYGGVGRNISDHLAKLGLDIEFITKLGNDALGKSLFSDLVARGIIIDKMVFSNGERTSIYMSVLDDLDDLLIAISSMEIMEEFPITRYLDRLNAADLLIIDGNIPKKTIDVIFDSVSCPIYVETVSFEKAKKFIPYLNQISFIKPNKNELTSLLRRDICNKADIEKGAKDLISAGVKEVIVTSGEEGSFYASKDASLWMYLVEPEIHRINGAGDALFSAFVLAKTFTDDIITQLKFSGAWTLAHLENKQIDIKGIGLSEEMLALINRVIIK